MPKMPVKISFDPEKNLDVAPIWAIPEGRILILLWRPCHIVNQYFWREALLVAKNIYKTKPRTELELRKCFCLRMCGYGSNFTDSDINNFAREALPYFTGEKSITITKNY